MTEGFRCPSCGFRIFSRRIAKCESCGAPLPAVLGLNSEQVAALDAQDERIRKTGSAFVRRNAPRGSIGGDGGAAGGDGGCDGDGGGD
jgi:DNA-directed RNA polymerase subunit RPC12/RpoP